MLYSTEEIRGSIWTLPRTHLNSNWLLRVFVFLIMQLKVLLFCRILNLSTYIVGRVIFLIMWRSRAGMLSHLTATVYSDVDD